MTAKIIDRTIRTIRTRRNGSPRMRSTPKKLSDRYVKALVQINIKGRVDHFVVWADGQLNLFHEGQI